MSLMFAKQFSEAGQASTTGRKGGRGKGSGMMAKSKGRKGRDLDDGGENGSSGGLFDAGGAYRTHMLFPGRKDEEIGGGMDPRRSSGSPGFMKGLMGSWGKRPSDPKAAAAVAASAGSQEMSGGQGPRYRTTPPHTRTESEFDYNCTTTSTRTHHNYSSSDPYNTIHHRNFNNNNKSVSFHDRVSEHAAAAATHRSSGYSGYGYSGGSCHASCSSASVPTNTLVTRSLTLSPTNTHAAATNNPHSARGTMTMTSPGENGHDYSYCYSNRESVYAIYGKTK